MIDADKLMDAASTPRGAPTGYTTEYDGETGTINTPLMHEKITDFDGILTAAGFDPAEFEIVGHPKVKTWDGQRADGTVRLFSYALSVRHRDSADQVEEALEYERRREELRTFVPSSKPKTTSGPKVAAVVNLADVQGGKSEGGGIAATRQRLTDGLENVQSWVDAARSQYNIEEIVLVNNGDPLEGCAGNYASQTFTVEANLREQMNFVLDFWDLYAKTLFPQFKKRQFISVLCNHGELGRFGASRNQTSDSDNAGGLLAEMLKRVYDESPDFRNVEWTIPHDEMNVYADVAGVPMGFNHGHKIKGHDATGFEKWLNGQVRGDRKAWEARIWQTAHRHNFQAWDLGSCTAFQAPSLDGGSKWLTDMTGRYSNSGILAYLVGNHSKLGWSDLAFL